MVTADMQSELQQGKGSVAPPDLPYAPLQQPRAVVVLHSVVMQGVCKGLVRGTSLAAGHPCLAGAHSVPCRLAVNALSTDEHDHTLSAV